MSFGNEIIISTIEGPLQIPNPNIAGLAAIPAGTPVNAVAATLTTALAGANNDMVFTAKTKGVAGNSITIRYINPGTETATESVVTTGTGIVVTLRSVSSVLSTAAQVKTAIEANTAANALVAIANSGGDTGAGAVIALAATPLAGGINGTIGVAKAVLADTSYLYVAIAANTVADGNWRRISLGSAF